MDLFDSPVQSKGIVRHSMSCGSEMICLHGSSQIDGRVGLESLNPVRVRPISVELISGEESIHLDIFVE